MIAGVGVDIVEVAKVAKLARDYPQKLNRVFTKKELSEAISLAEIFAAKEAVLKVLGTGWVSGLTWTDVEIAPRRGVPSVRLRGGARKIARKVGIKKILVDMSSTPRKSVAQAIGIKI